MKIINLQQNSNEWYEFRKNKIGASDFALFCCYKKLSQPIFRIDFNDHIYKKQHSIFEDLSINSYIQYGIDREPILLKQYNIEKFKVCAPTVCQSLDNERIFASLDGYDPFNPAGAVEIKTTSASIQDFENKLQYYIFQLTHQLYTGDLKYVDIFMECSDGVMEKRIFKKELPISKEQWLLLCKEYLHILDKKVDLDIISLLKKYDDLSNQIKYLSDQKDILRKQFEELNLEGVYDNFVVKKVEKTTTNYSNLVKDLALEVPEKYKTTSFYLKITNKIKEK